MLQVVMTALRMAKCLLNAMKLASLISCWKASIFVECSIFQGAPYWERTNTYPLNFKWGRLRSGHFSGRPVAKGFENPLAKS